MKVPSDNADEDEGDGEDDADGAGVASDGLRGARSDRADADGGAAGGEADFDAPTCSR